MPMKVELYRPILVWTPINKRSADLQGWFVHIPAVHSIIMNLSLSVSTGDQQEYTLQESHADVIARSNYTCSYCGFQSISHSTETASTAERNGYMQVHATSYYVKDSVSNLQCVCPFCYQTLNLQIVENPIFIYFPWITQEQLNHLLLLIFSIIRMGTDDHLSNQATKVFLRLQKYKNYVGQINQTYAESPEALVKVLCWMAEEEPEEYKNRGKVLRDIRLMPTTPPVCKGFQDELSFWNTYKWYQENLRFHWEEILNTFDYRFN